MRALWSSANFSIGENQELTLNKHHKTLLEQVGRDLDLSVFPVVHNGGLVLPGPRPVVSFVPGKESHNDWKRQRTSRSSTGSWKGPQARTRETGTGTAVRSRKAGTASPLAFIDAPADVDEELQQLMEHYPAASVWRQEEGLWLFVPCTLLPDSGRPAGFVIAIVPRDNLVRGWGFWLGGDIGASWIGPRHTNYPDGSICAFDADDGTWTFGDSLLTLVDMYSVWAVRHLYFEQFGRWPGPQSSSHPYERLIEFEDSEHCSCEAVSEPYGRCCKASDLKRRILANAIDFALGTNRAIRKPPSPVALLALRRSSPPPLLATLSECTAVH